MASDNRQNMISRRHMAFTLIEIITVLAITVTIMMATLKVFSRVRTNAALIRAKLDENVMATEILQRIAEDLDTMVASGPGTTVAIKNKLDNRFHSAQLVITNRIYGSDPESKPKPQIFEKVVWQANYDPFEGTLMLYRSHSGINLEDKVIDEQLLELGKQELFIPLCTGVTYFGIEVPGTKNTNDQWTGGELPRSIIATISFAAPYETAEGEMDIPESGKISRVIALDRTRMITYKFVKKDFDLADIEDLEEEEEEEEDPNEVTQAKTSSDRDRPTSGSEE